ncbi:CHAT domain-containing protein [Actinomycetospora sp. CA-101289]|uniref:CHAT domain-containing protein n=1 Tax=Actinomycetospora sp. CA-101289 TaxID=3239893 RepID=UPI003D9810B6
MVDRGVGDRRRVSVSWVGGAPLTHETEVELPVDEAESERVRWYLEDYAEFPADPAPAVARSAEELLASVGRELFERVFAARGAARVWTSAEAELAAVRVEIDTDPSDAPGVPWELLRDPDSDRPVALGAAEFVRTHHQTARAVRLPSPTAGPLRVLLVICRPGGEEDVPFRSVASRLVRSSVDRLDGVDLEVLRPPTFARLAAVLRSAAEAGRGFHIVHFDGHGAFLDTGALGDDAVAVSALTFGPTDQTRPGRHGYLLFEDPQHASGQRLVDGPTMAGLLVETGVPVLVLNACRSAYAEAPAAPDPAAGVHDRIRAYGSLAAEVADQGVPGVVAMRYNVYVETAARFVEDLYRRLASGGSLGAAVSGARKALAADPRRRIAATPVELQDWLVPTVYEPEPLTLRTAQASFEVAPEPPTVGVPDAPDIGFFGRDEALLALDRAFDSDRVVLLHALAGAGKTTTAAEFARWYTATGGVDAEMGGEVLWTSFEHHIPLDRVLDTAGAALTPLLEASDIHWAAITDPAQRRAVILRVLAAVPVLWVWDNVEPVTGFPTGAPSAWSEQEQTELRTFLRELRDRTRTKVLLTSRRDEHPWLGDLPQRVRLQPMPMRERLQLTHALVRRLSRTPRSEDIDWHRLLRFTGGNPLAITVALRQAVLREQVTSTAQLEAFVAQVEAGAAGLEPAENAELGRSDSLAASLAYGFAHAFTDTEHAQLALLHLFQDTVSTDALLTMGDAQFVGDDALPALAIADRDQLTALLNRAAELGLLTRFSGGYYGIHPALPWFFADLFTTHVLDPDAAQRAYTSAHATLGDVYFDVIEDGHTAVLSLLRMQEANLRHALRLARIHNFPKCVISCAQGLRKLFSLTGRDVEWARLVADFVGEYIDPASDLPRPGREDHYSIVAGYCVQLAKNQRDWATAIRLQTDLTAWVRDRATEHLQSPPERLDPIGRSRLRALAVSEQHLGDLLHELDDPACREHFQAQYDVAEQIGDTRAQAAAASSMGNAYLVVTGLRDVLQAEYWHKRHLDLVPEHDRIGRAGAHGSLANVNYNRFREARDAGASAEELTAYLEEARAGYEQVLDLLPDDHHIYRATSHNQLGLLHRLAGDVPRAIGHFQRSIRHKEARGNAYGAGETRHHIALLLAENGRRSDALLYARAALTNFQQVGPGARAEAAAAERLIRRLEDQSSEQPS